MDDVDQIVLSSLNEIGYEVPPKIVNLKLCPFKNLVEMVICCLNAIKPELDVPRILPPSMSVKFNLCNQLAIICKELGYKSDIGYHTFLYTNPTDVRNVLIFLVQLLPRQVNFEEVEKNENKGSSTIKQKTAEELKKILNSKSREHYGMYVTPFVSTALETGTLLPNQKIDCQPLEWRDFVAEKLPFVDQQVINYESFLPSLISLNSYGILNPRKIKCSSYNLKSLEESFFQIVSSRGPLNNTQSDTSTIQIQLPNFQADDGSMISEENERVVSETNQEIKFAFVEKEMQNAKAELATFLSKFKDISKFNNDLKKKLEEKTAHESTLEQSLQLLPDSENNIPKLLAVNKKVENKIQKYKAQWQQGRELLLNRKAELKEALNTKTSEKNELIQNILELRKELSSVAEQIEKKKIIKQKLAERNELSGVQRTEYIQRIFEIIKNIKKQGTQIDKILGDMRIVQKEINTLSGKINRSFSVAEQMIISNSRNDEFSAETRKLLLQLHKDISDILTMTGESGNHCRESKDLEEQLQTIEDDENIAISFQQVCADLQRLRDEEALMMKQMTSLERKEKAFPVPKLDTNQDSDLSNEKKFRNIIIDKTGYPVLEDFSPLGDRNTKGASESTSKVTTSS